MQGNLSRQSPYMFWNVKYISDIFYLVIISLVLSCIKDNM